MRKAKRINPNLWRLGYNQFWKNSNLYHLSKNKGFNKLANQIDIFFLQFINTYFNSLDANCKVIDHKVMTDPTYSNKIICRVFYIKQQLMPWKFYKIFRYKKFSFGMMLRFLKKYKFASLYDHSLSLAAQKSSFENIQSLNDFVLWHKNYFLRKLPKVNVSGYQDKHWARIQFLIKHRIYTLTLSQKKSLYFNIWYKKHKRYFLNLPINLKFQKETYSNQKLKKKKYCRKQQLLKNFLKSLKKQKFFWFRYVKFYWSTYNRNTVKLLTRNLFRLPTNYFFRFRENPQKKFFLHKGAFFLRVISLLLYNQMGLSFKYRKGFQKINISQINNFSQKKSRTCFFYLFSKKIKRFIKKSRFFKKRRTISTFSVFNTHLIWLKKFWSTYIRWIFQIINIAHRKMHLMTYLWKLKIYSNKLNYYAFLENQWRYIAPRFKFKINRKWFIKKYKDLFFVFNHKMPKAWRYKRLVKMQKFYSLNILWKLNYAFKHKLSKDHFFRFKKKLFFKWKKKKIIFKKIFLPNKSKKEKFMYLNNKKLILALLNKPQTFSVKNLHFQQIPLHTFSRLDIFQPQLLKYKYLRVFSKNPFLLAVKKKKRKLQYFYKKTSLLRRFVTCNNFNNFWFFFINNNKNLRTLINVFKHKKNFVKYNFFCSMQIFLNQLNVKFWKHQKKKRRIKTLKKNQAFINSFYSKKSRSKTLLNNKQYFNRLKKNLHLYLKLKNKNLIQQPMSSKVKIHRLSKNLKDSKLNLIPWGLKSQPTLKMLPKFKIKNSVKYSILHKIFLNFKLSIFKKKLCTLKFKPHYVQTLLNKNKFAKYFAFYKIFFRTYSQTMKKRIKSLNYFDFVYSPLRVRQKAYPSKFYSSLMFPSTRIVNKEEKLVLNSSRNFNIPFNFIGVLKDYLAIWQNFALNWISYYYSFVYSKFHLLNINKRIVPKDFYVYSMKNKIFNRINSLTYSSKTAKTYFGCFRFNSKNLLEFFKKKNFNLLYQEQNKLHKFEKMFEKKWNIKVKFELHDLTQSFKTLQYNSNYQLSRPVNMLVEDFFTTDLQTFRNFHRLMRRRNLFVYFEFLLLAFLTGNYQVIFNMLGRFLQLSRSHRKNFFFIKQLLEYFWSLVGYQPKMHIEITGRMGGVGRRTIWKHTYGLAHHNLKTKQHHIEYILCDFTTYASAVSIKVWHYLNH